MQALWFSDLADQDRTRNPEPIRYGFVYFSDDLRVAYTTREGVVSDATGGWPAITATHARLAKELLDQEIPGWYVPAEE